MSFAEKLTGLIAGPENAQSGDIPWYLRYGARGLGIVGAFIAMLFGMLGLFSVITLNFTVVLSSILQILIGIVVMSIEAPICCMFIDHVQKLSQIVETKPHYYRAGGYCLGAILPVCLDFTITRIFVCGLIFATGALYGMMSIGKKASLEQMRQAAAAEAATATATSSDNRNGTMRPGSNLVNNAQPFSFTNPPPYVNNV